MALGFERPSPGTMSVTSRALLPSLSIPITLLLAATIPMASGHDHDSTHIEEGSTISADPIVRLNRSGRL